MTVEITPGINLTVVPTQKFKTTQITWRFLAPLTARNLNQRSLLAAVLENSSERYQTPKELNELLADLYGATFGVDVLRRGNVHEIAFTLNVVNDKFLGAHDESILAKAFDFLAEVMFYPALTGRKFDVTIVEREKQHLLSNLAALMEDKQDYALVKLQEQYYNEPAQAYPFYGNADEIKNINEHDLYNVYQDMMTNNLMSIIVVGDLHEKDVIPLIQRYQLKERPKVTLDYFYKQPLKQEVGVQTEQDNVVQAKLSMMYQTNIYFGQELYYSLLVCNGLFGGFPHSKLFMNIREKASLAYYASSYVDAYRGTLAVQSGIATENKDQVIKLVEEQLAALTRGDFTDEELKQTKAMLIGQYLNRLDIPQALKEQAVIQQTFKDLKFTTETYVDSIEHVTREMVIEVAKQIKLQNIYCLEGSE